MNTKLGDFKQLYTQNLRLQRLSSIQLMTAFHVHYCKRIVIIVHSILNPFRLSQLFPFVAHSTQYFSALNSERVATCCYIDTCLV